ncbi:MAG TPA: hypothetical protein VNT20_02910 [Flavisolibacter sp.]|jgi:hypothetical protein|nr:hypothetical protein [Flavisolibacter sp.]
MSIDRKNAGVNHQDHPHQEGQQNNTPPIHEFDGQRRSNTQKQSMSNIMNESDEQKARDAHSQKDERSVQENE